MIREEIGNTVVRFYSDKATAQKVADVMKLSVLEYNHANRFIVAKDKQSSEVFDESGMIFHPKSLAQSSSYKQDLCQLMMNSNIV